VNRFPTGRYNSEGILSALEVSRMSCSANTAVQLDNIARDEKVKYIIIEVLTSYREKSTDPKDRSAIFYTIYLRFLPRSVGTKCT
jgi:hypothetical protein